MKFIITGSSRGLGYHLTERLISHGCVVGISRSLGHADIFSRSGSFMHIQYDFSLELCEDEFNILVEKLISFIGNEPFTLILNSANFYTGIERLSNSKLMTLFKINVFSLMSLVQALERHKLRRVFIVNSIAGLIGQRQQHEYSASKHAVMGFARSLAKSAKHTEYDVMCINPGGIKTELWSNYEEVDTSDFLSPDTVADVCVSLILIPQRTFIENMLILPPSDV